MENNPAGSPAALLVVTGIIDWSMIAQFRAGLSRLVSGLAAIPAWQAGDCDLPGLERVLEHATA